MRRITDVKEGLSGANVEQKDSEGNPRSNDLSSPFGSLKRTQTGPVSAGLNGHSSPWVNAPQSAGFAPMGAFGSFGVMDSASSEKRPGFGSVRGESRFKGLMTSGSSENINSIIQEKSSNSNLGKLSEADNEQSLKWEGAHRESGHDADHDEDDMDEMDRPAGSAALGGVDASPTGPPSSRFRSSDRQISYDEIGFSSLGMSSDMPFREMMQRREFSHQQTPQRSHATMQPNEPMSPTDTNPYQSPEGERAMPNAMDHDEPDFPHSHFHGQGGFGQPGRNFQSQLESHDRSQTSSTGPPKPFSGLGGLGNLGSLGGSNPWSAAPGAIGTPSRAQPSQTPGFGDSAFGNYGDIGTPAQGAVGGGGFFGAAAANSNNSGAVGRGSKLGSLFPSSTQDLGLGEGQRQEQLFREGNELFSRNSQGYSGTPRDLEGLPSRANQMDDLPGGDKRLSGPQGFGSLADRDAGQAPGSGLLQTAFSGAPSNSTFFARSQDSDHPAPPNQLPTSQQRQMVMPDRMRWIYRDPQGATQGPWSGLEMHDWYKAGFFSPELQVKKLEDTEYEPLAQLIRRIGNSREPFLVPQIGIPHGAPTSASIGGPSSATAPASTAQPPFASSFPSFGTTLTAEQQNALERRKQEEQYLMARQKEHLAQQQVYLKQMQHMQGGLHNQQLHHQSSGHSLHSQPSFGSITSPTGYQPPPAQGPIQPPPQMPAFFDTSLRNAGPLSAEVLGSVREEDMPGLVERLNIGRGNQMQFSGPQGMDHQQRVNLMMQERNRLSREQEQFDMLQRSDDDPRLTAERLEQYKQLRSQEDDNQHPQPGPIGGQTNRLSASARDFEEPQEEAPSDNRLPEPLSLSEQVQKAAAKQPSTTQPQSPWAKVDAGMPQSLPPPQSSSPMPAPTPQRNRQSVAEALNAESQSPQTESVETPSATVAPWAKDNSETMKGPSLKEIQEVEAQKAAQREEMQAAARRAVAEQERLSQQNQTGTAPAPGLPSSANWASGVPPAVPATPGVSAWTKPNGGKPTVATPVPAAKKTLAQIQKEEEARKSRAAAAAAAAVASAAGGNANMTATAGGKRYADLAGRGGQSTAPNPNNVAWTTVGAGGKAKAPPAPTPSMATRTSSGGVAPPSAVSTKPKPAAMPSTKSSQQNASDELQKWTKNALNKGLDSKIPRKFALTIETESYTSFHYKPPNGNQITDDFYSRRLRSISSRPSTRTRHHLRQHLRQQPNPRWSPLRRRIPATSQTRRPRRHTRQLLARDIVFFIREQWCGKQERKWGLE